MLAGKTFYLPNCLRFEHCDRLSVEDSTVEDSELEELEVVVPKAKKRISKSEMQKVIKSVKFNPESLLMRNKTDTSRTSP